MPEYDVSFTVRGSLRAKAHDGKGVDAAVEAVVRNMLSDPEMHDALGDHGASLTGDLVIDNFALWKVELL